MTTYPYRVFNAVQGSEFVPAFVRVRLLRAVGLKIPTSSTVWAGCSFRSKKIEIGSNVFINIGFYFDGDNFCFIDSNVRIGQFVKVITGTHDVGPSSQRATVEVVSKPVEIGQGCWIGAGVTILPGVSIGRGCVIGANSIVSKSTEADGMYIGSPARRVKELPI